MTKTPKFCKDCKHFMPHPRVYSWSKCAMSMSSETDLVTGAVTVSYSDCKYERRFLGACGPEANLFEPFLETRPRPPLWRRVWDALFTDLL